MNPYMHCNCLAVAWMHSILSFAKPETSIFFIPLHFRCTQFAHEWWMDIQIQFFFVVVALSIPLEQTDVTFIYIYAECWMQRDNTAGMAWQDKCVWTRNGIHFFLHCISCCMHAFNALLGHFLSFLFFFSSAHHRGENLNWNNGDGGVTERFTKSFSPVRQSHSANGNNGRCDSTFTC